MNSILYEIGHKGVDDLWYHMGDFNLFFYVSLFFRPPSLTLQTPWLASQTLWLAPRSSSRPLRPFSWLLDPPNGLSDALTAPLIIYPASQTAQLAFQLSNWYFRHSDCPGDHLSDHPDSQTFWQASQTSWLASQTL